MQLPAQPIKRSSDWVLQLINIVFLLLLFYLVNGTIANQQETQIVPPKSILVTAGVPPSDAVYIGVDGIVKFRGEPRTALAVRTALARAGKIGTVQIVADRGLKAARLVEVLREFRAIGLNDLSLVTVREDLR